MPRREQTTVPMPQGEASPALRTALFRPDNANGGTRPAVAIHRGLSASEQEIDLLEALAEALGQAGLIVALPEPRTAQLILDDFNDFGFADDVRDILATLTWLRRVEGVDGARVGLIGWSIGAISAAQAASQEPSMARLCLVNPATPQLLASRSPKNGNGAVAAHTESLPRRFRDDIVALAARQSPPALSASALIVHAAGDRIFHPEASLELLASSVAGAPSIDRCLVARADHAFTDPACRIALFERLASYFTETSAARSSRPAVGAAT